MSAIGSAETYLQYFEAYKRKPLDPLNNKPRAIGDYRERVERETIRGRYGVFHMNIEQYLNRQWRAYTVPRMAAWWFISLGFFQHSIFKFHTAFPNVASYKNVYQHPNYKLLGPINGAFYVLRPFFWGYITFRLTR